MPPTCSSVAVASSKAKHFTTTHRAIRPTKLGGLAGYIAVLTEWFGLSPVESLLRLLASGVPLTTAESERRYEHALGRALPAASEF
jgi:hypothetical protein